MIPINTALWLCGFGIVVGLCLPPIARWLVSLGKPKSYCRLRVWCVRPQGHAGECLTQSEYAERHHRGPP